MPRRLSSTGMVYWLLDRCVIRHGNVSKRMIVTVYLTILLNMDGKKPAKCRWYPYNCLLCNDDHEELKKIIPLQLSVLNIQGKAGFWGPNSLLPHPFFLRVKDLGTRLG